MESHRDLLAEVETLLAEGGNDAALWRILTRHKPSFLSLLQYKARTRSRDKRAREQGWRRAQLACSRGNR